jgi:hypothetical protein
MPGCCCCRSSRSAPASHHHGPAHLGPTCSDREGQRGARRAWGEGRPTSRPVDPGPPTPGNGCRLGRSPGQRGHAVLTGGLRGSIAGRADRAVGLTPQPLPAARRRHWPSIRDGRFDACGPSQGALSVVEHRERRWGHLPWPAMSLDVIGDELSNRPRHCHRSRSRAAQRWGSGRFPTRLPGRGNEWSPNPRR